MVAAVVGWRGATILRDRQPWAVWQRSISEGANVPMRAELRLMHRRHGISYTTDAHVVLGPHGQFRMEYTNPPEARGRIVYSDGHTNWQYEPASGVVTKTELLPDSPSDDGEVEDLIARNYRIALVSDQDTGAGRPAYIVELLPRQPGKSTQRRWIDRATYRTLRIETHYPDGILARLVAYSSVNLPAVVSGADFRPPRGPAPMLVSSGPSTRVVPVRDLAACASSLGLSAGGTLGFRLRQVADSQLGRTQTAHLLYTDGIESVSVFVQQGSLPARPTAHWHAIHIRGETAYENRDGHMDAVVWAGSGHRYTAVSHLEPTALHEFVEGQLPHT